MKSRVSSSAKSSKQPAFYRYLKPGALARIRDSKFTAKSKGQSSRDSLMDIKPTGSASAEMISQTTPMAQVPMDTVPSFPCSGIGHFSPSGPRKKLFAAAPAFSDSQP